MEVIFKVINPCGNFPNNLNLPLLLYKNVLNHMSPKEVLKHFEKNGWIRGWINGIYDFHHYHSNIHEALGICKGTATVQVGGNDGPVFEIKENDLLILPVGVAHKKLTSTDNFVCVGAYPFDIPYDMNEGTESELIAAEKRIQHVPLPARDPVWGDNGPLLTHWKSQHTFNEA